MNVYERFIKKQNEIMALINLQEQKESELAEIKNEIYKIHLDKIKRKPFGKSTIKHDGFEITYNRTEKIKLLETVVKQRDFHHPCIKEKTTTKLTLSKSDWNKLSDEEREKLQEFVIVEASKPTMSVKMADE